MATPYFCIASLWMAQYISKASKYILVEQELIRDDASAYCLNAYGTHLASIHDASDNQEASDLCKITPNCAMSTCDDWLIACHIGLNDRVSERGTSRIGWVWDDGSTYDYQNWRDTEPNEGGNGLLDEDCGAIFPSEHPDIGHQAHWADMECTMSFYFLCNAPSTKNPTDNPSRNPSNIPTVHPTKSPSNWPSKKPSNPADYTSINPTHNPTNYPSSNPSINPTHTPTTKPSSTPTQPSILNTILDTQHGLLCGDNVHDTFDANSMGFSVVIPYDGTITFDASLSNASVTDIKAYSASDDELVIATDSNHDNVLLLDDVLSGHYIFVVSGNASISATLAITISCELTVHVQVPHEVTQIRSTETRSDVHVNANMQLDWLLYALVTVICVVLAISLVCVIHVIPNLRAQAKRNEANLANTTDHEKEPHPQLETMTTCTPQTISRMPSTGSGQSGGKDPALTIESGAELAHSPDSDLPRPATYTLQINDELAYTGSPGSMVVLRLRDHSSDVEVAENIVIRKQFSQDVSVFVTKGEAVEESKEGKNDEDLSKDLFGSSEDQDLSKDLFGDSDDDDESDLFGDYNDDQGGVETIQ